ncbi:MAG: hypothetical protein ACLQUY_25350 [Ktedonobacterales bacterium]
MRSPDGRTARLATLTSSIATIREIEELKRRHKALVCLRGNHEDSWLAHWNGANVDSPPDINGAAGIWQRYRGNIPTDVGKWLEATHIEYEDVYA